MGKAIPMPDRLLLRLYVAGSAANSLQAIANLRTICDAHFATAHDLEIVDLLKEPLRALDDGVIVTPTLVKVSPLPVRRLIGNLNDTGEVVRVLAAT